MTSHPTADGADAPFRDAERSFYVEDQQIAWLIRGFAGQVRMPGDAEILAKGSASA